MMAWYKTLKFALFATATATATAVAPGHGDLRLI